MAIPVLIMGKSGTGKSTSLRNMPASDVALVNVQGKPLPFRGKLDSYQTKDFGKITSVVSKTKRRVVVVDDFGYAITDYYTRHSLGKERDYDQFEVYKSIAAYVYNFVDAIQRDKDENKIVYFIMHSDTDNYGSIQPATVGKLLNEKISIVGMVTICIISTITENGEYKFVVNGTPPAKSPLGMFEGDEVDNDLFAVDAAIRNYWGLESLAGNENEKKEKANG